MRMIKYASIIVERQAGRRFRANLRWERLLKNRQTLAKWILLLTAFIWGTGFIISQVALDAGFQTSGLMLGKFGIASVILGIAFRKTIREKMSVTALKRAVPIGIMLAASFFGQTLGLKNSTPSNCALITASYVVITPFFWRLVFKKRLPVIAYVASVLCFFGISALSFDLSGGVSFRTGDLWTLMSAVLFAAQIVATEAFVGDLDYRLLLFIEMVTAAVCSLIPFLLFERDLSPFLTPAGMGSMLFLGVLSTCICYVMQTWSQRYVPSGTAALILSLESLFGSALSVIFGYDPAEPKLFVGAALVLLSIMLPELISMFGRKRSAQDGAKPV